MPAGGRGCRARGGLVAVVGARLWPVILLLLIALVVPLILGVADGIAAHCAERTADGGTFETTATLVANDATKSRATESADDGAGLGIGAGGTGEAGNSHSKNSKFS